MVSGVIIGAAIVKHLENRNGVASPCRTTCTVCGDAPCYAFLSIQLYVSTFSCCVSLPCCRRFYGGLKPTLRFG
ncbi:hypothetical protein HMPREF9080_03029 [Cardiobacterium valvarum F0432]|uniref:Uncharacterized protein n=1 Tax=Cardiobacterium valvarum F0432 TaxID=797473 RepID=G9ZJR0_9GAMM|nr:hypothetical protein HMPREF9080_03029 [Cardiobacterium valvarum F0432]